MAFHFSQSKIDEYKECFGFNAKRNFIDQEGELSLIMRSLGFSPTREEINVYLKKFKDEDGKMNFASFLDVLHEHSQVEDTKKEILQAFQAHDVDRKGFVPASELKHILMNLGDKMSRQEIESLFREFNVPLDGPVNYNAFLKQLITPFPDYEL